VGAVFFFSVHGIRRVVSFLVPLHQCRVRIRKYVLVGSICGGGRILLLSVHGTRTEVPKWQLYLYIVQETK